MRCAVPGPCLEGPTGENNGSGSSRRGTDDQTVVGRTAMAKRGQALPKARAVKKPAKPAVAVKEQIAELKRELAQAMERQAAASGVLKVISRSTFDLQTVLETLAATAIRLCSAERGFVLRLDGEALRYTAGHNLSPELREFLECNPIPLVRTTINGRAALERRTAHIPDVRNYPEYSYGGVQVDPYRTVLSVPMCKAEQLIGVFCIYRHEVRPFTDSQIALMETFADQAVIAIENARLVGELRERTGDLEESLKYQTATSDVLKVIRRSTFDLQRVLDTLIQTAAELCETSTAAVAIRQGDVYRYVATAQCAPEYDQALRSRSLVPGRDSVVSRVLLERKVVHIVDAETEPGYDFPDAVNIGRVRTLLGVPMFCEDDVVGVIGLSRQHVEPFTERQIELMRTFADQAVIAIENARLLGELRERTADLQESLEYQTATSDVLKVISRSTFDLQPILDTLVATAVRLCHADLASINIRDRDVYRVVASFDYSPELSDYARNFAMSPGRETVTGRAALERRVVHVADVTADPEYKGSGWITLGNVRTGLGVPLLRDGEPIGVIALFRRRVEQFTDRQIELVGAFADQAVVAMENARLLGELRERTTDLARSVDELTATGDVLKIISRSSVDLETVLDTLVETVARLCRADHTLMFRRREDLYHLFASRGISAEAKDFFLAHPFASGRETVTGRTALERRAVHVADVLQDPEYTYRAPTFTGARTLLGIPLLREEALVGIFVIGRTSVEPFTNKEIELVITFADQAVIAIENARLFEELRERQSELRVTFDNMGDGVVMFDTAARLAAWNRNLQKILDLPDAFLGQRPSYAEYFRYLAERGEYAADLEAELSRTIEDTSREMRFERTRPDGRVIEVRRNPVPGGGFVLIYADITERKRAEEAIRAARDAAEAALRELQAAQASLLHAQKMAALGQLTAGIAHEIKNPLNFVNNFAGLSVELLDELKEATAQAIGPLDADKCAEIVDTIGMLTSNLAKIAEHGRRADSIVRSMLQHSRGGSGERQSTDPNALVEEALNLAYHGARAHDQNFNITVERAFDPAMKPVELVPQDITRVFLNLFGNGFYAANKRARAPADSGFRPVLRVATRDAGDVVEVKVRDNGIGIPSGIRDKLFQPFFTTKPTGEGTGLGLSISYDIVTQQHGGTISVDSEEGVFTEFTVRLPRRRRAPPANGRA
jgi:two-component system, NtrC family, sensor kinase